MTARKVSVDKPCYMCHGEGYYEQACLYCQEVKQGEHWYIKLKDATVLSEVAIIDITSKTVSIKFLDAYWNWTIEPKRYERSEIKFVEKIHKDK